MPDVPLTQTVEVREGELSGLLDCMLDPLFIISAETGLIAHCNTAAVRWQGCDRGALVGQPFNILLAESEHTSRRELLERTCVYGHVFVEQTFALRGGQTVRADLSASMWHRADGDAVVLVLRDAEQRLAAQRLEVDARQTAARLDTLARLSHEINNPLQALLMHDGAHFDESVRGHINQIVGTMHRMREEEAVPPPHRPLPAAPDACPAHGTLAPADTRRILVADDSDSIRRSLGLLLRSALPDTTVDLAGDGEDALARFKEGHPAVMVLDILMPRKTGDEVVEDIVAFCRQEQWEEPRIVFCTGYTPPPVVQAALAPPSRHTCLLKPVPPRDLLAAVEELVAAARTERDEKGSREERDPGP
jgi:two-component system chemotaxis response regulator CheY